MLGERHGWLFLVGLVLVLPHCLAVQDFTEPGPCQTRSYSLVTKLPSESGCKLAQCLVPVTVRVPYGAGACGAGQHVTVFFFNAFQVYLHFQPYHADLLGSSHLSPGGPTLGCMTPPLTCPPACMQHVPGMLCASKGDVGPTHSTASTVLRPSQNMPPRLPPPIGCTLLSACRPSPSSTRTIKCAWPPMVLPAWHMTWAWAS